jgi:hypothetical protein
MAHKIIHSPHFPATSAAAEASGHTLGPWQALDEDDIKTIWRATCTVRECNLVVEVRAFTGFANDRVEFPKCPKL